MKLDEEVKKYCGYCGKRVFLSRIIAERIRQSGNWIYHGKCMEVIERRMIQSRQVQTSTDAIAKHIAAQQTGQPC